MSRAALHPHRGQSHLVGARRDDRGRRRLRRGQLGLSAVLEEKDGTKSYWALAHPAATSPISTTPLASPRGFPKQRRMTLFGIDRLLAEPELRRPLEGKRVALLAHPASVTRDLTHSLDALVAAGLNVTAAFGPQHGAPRRQAGQYGGVRRLHRSGPRHPGVQPLRRGAPPDRPVDGHVRHDPDRPPGPRLPDLHLHHDACSTCSRPRPSTARASGCSTGPTPPDARSRD